MRDLIDLQKILFPDLLEVIQRRYKVLHGIQLLEPIGRRSLAEQIQMKERIVRSEIEFLHKQSLLDVTAKGVSLTKTGVSVVQQLAKFMNEVSGYHELEQQVKQTLSLDHVIITPGDSDEQAWVKYDLGRKAVEFLLSIISSDQTIAVTGGTSMAAVAEMMHSSDNVSDCMFVPARGGLGERVENQANTICSEMAKKANGDYRLLYVPDPLSEETYRSIIQEPGVEEILHIIRQADVVMHGIGDALTLAKRRKASSEVLTKLVTGNAVSEAFGYYFDHIGQVVHKVRTVGMQLEDLSRIRTVIAVAGGKSKAKAIESYFRQGKSNVLITDEAAAQALIKGFSL